MNKFAYKFVNHENMNTLVQYLMNMNPTSGGIAIGTTSAADIKLASNIDPVLAGVIQSTISAAEHDVSACITSTKTTVADGKKAVVALAFDGSGDPAVFVGPDVEDDDDVKAAVPDFDPESYVVAGLVLVQNDSGSAFTVGTTNLSATGITDTYYDVCQCFPGQEVG